MTALRMLMALSVLCLCATSVQAETHVPQALQQGNGPRDCVPLRVEPSLEIGLGDRLPKSYYLLAFPQAKESKPLAYLPFLRIKADGTASLTLFPTAKTTKDLQLSDLDHVMVTEIFGAPDSSRTGEVTFHMIGWDRTEPNIFHVDFVFGSGGHVMSYKVRGFRITQPNGN